MAGEPIKVDFSAITELSPDCNWPLRPLNNTHCSGITYGAHINSLNNSVLIYLIVFWTIQLGSLISFILRYRSLNEDSENTVEARTNLKWIIGWTVTIFAGAADVRSSFGYTPLWWFRCMGHSCIVFSQGTFFRYALGYRKALEIKKSKTTLMMYKVVHITFAVLAVLSITLELPFLVYVPGKGIGTYYTAYEIPLLVIQVLTNVTMITLLVTNCVFLVVALKKSEKTGIDKGKHNTIIMKLLGFTIAVSAICSLFGRVIYGRLMSRIGNEFSAYTYPSDDVYPWKGIVLVTNVITLVFFFLGPKSLKKKGKGDGSTAAASSVADSSSFGGSSAASSSAASSSAVSSSV